MFGGASGHVDEVLSISIHASGRFLASAGMDHAVKIWDLSLPHIQAAMGQGARVTAVHFCIFSNRHIHTNYVDSVRWFGDWVVSKAVGSRLCFWRPAVDLFGNEASAKASFRVELASRRMLILARVCLAARLFCPSRIKVRCKSWPLLHLAMLIFGICLWW